MDRPMSLFEFGTATACILHVRLGTYVTAPALPYARQGTCVTGTHDMQMPIYGRLASDTLWRKRWGLVQVAATFDKKKVEQRNNAARKYIAAESIVQISGHGKVV